jgi:AcrR family transcriptional regulator
MATINAVTHKAGPAAGTTERKTRRDGLATKQAILISAEKLFSESGLDGVSIREITKASRVDLALVNYHFKSKENLFAATLSMRIDEMSGKRLALLERIEIVEYSEQTLRDILDAFTKPYVGLTKKEEKSLSDYRRLVALVANSKRWQSTIFEQHYDPTTRRFVEALQQTLPRATPASLYWSMSFFLGALVNAFAETGRIDRLSGGECNSGNLEEIRRNIVDFMIGGLLGSTGLGEKVTRRRRK